MKVDDKEGPFLIELLRKFPFVKDVSPGVLNIVLIRSEVLWELKGSSLFQSRADFNKWLDAPNLVLKNDKPVSMLRDDAGYKLVLKALGRLEHGIMA